LGNNLNHRRDSRKAVVYNTQQETRSSLVIHETKVQTSQAMIKPGLERISLLLKDVPLTWRAIHVAGTNGKGSICAYISAVLQAANVRTGRFTSPHFIDRWDGICVNGEPVAESVFREVEDGVKWKNEKNAINASEFEILTATAFEVFNRERVEVGVVEVGMGGLQDATNVLERPLVTVISQIGLDHQAFLGDTLSAIAFQKAGIMKTGVPCVVDGHNDEAVLEVFKNRAEHYGSQLIIAPTGARQRIEEDDAEVNFGVAHDFGIQTAIKRNMWCAYKALQYAMPQLESGKGKPAGETARDLTNRGIMLQGSLPGRFQSISLEPLVSRKKYALMDGAHNKEAWTGLGEYVTRQVRSSRKSPITWVFTLSGGRDHRPFIETCWTTGDNLVTVEFGPVEGMPWVKPTASSELIDAFKSALPEDEGRFHSCGRDINQALQTATTIADGGPLVISGSLYLVSDVLRALRSANRHS